MGDSRFGQSTPAASWPCDQRSPPSPRAVLGTPGCTAIPYDGTHAPLGTAEARNTERRRSAWRSVASLAHSG
eukprot:7640179-Lingulodinium_polyedra.AAC.1